MPLQPTTGLPGYDSATFREWLPRQTHVARSSAAAMLLQLAPPGARGTNETDVGADDTTFKVLLWREGTAQLDARVDRPIRRAIPRGGFVCVPPGATSWWASTPESAHQVLHLHLCLAALPPELVPPGLPSLPAGYGGRSAVLAALADLLVGAAGDGPPTALLLDAAAHVAMHEVVRQHAPGTRREPAGGRLAAWQVRRALEFIDAHLGEDIPLATLAATVRLSPFHFARCFHATLGEPPHRYQVRRRIDRARELLASSDLRVLDVALAVGYESPQALARAFRRILGVSPARYRRERLAAAGRASGDWPQ